MKNSQNHWDQTVKGQEMRSYSLKLSVLQGEKIPDVDIVSNTIWGKRNGSAVKTTMEESLGSVPSTCLGCFTIACNSSFRVTLWPLRAPTWVRMLYWGYACAHKNYANVYYHWAVYYMYAPQFYLLFQCWRLSLVLVHGKHWLFHWATPLVTVPIFGGRQVKARSPVDQANPILPM